MQVTIFIVFHYFELKAVISFDPIWFNALLIFTNSETLTYIFVLFLHILFGYSLYWLESNNNDDDLGKYS